MVVMNDEAAFRDTESITSYTVLVVCLRLWQQFSTSLLVSLRQSELVDNGLLETVSVFPGQRLSQVRAAEMLDGMIWEMGME